MRFSVEPDQRRRGATLKRRLPAEEVDSDVSDPLRSSSFGTVTPSDENLIKLYTSETRGVIARPKLF